MIEQFMIMANQAAGKLAKEKNIPFVYRIHASLRQRESQHLQI